MKGLGRNIKYWFMYSVKSFLLVSVMMVAIVTVTSFMDADKLDLSGTLVRTAGYIAFSTFILVMVNAFNNISVCYPMTVSLGSTRMPSLLGMTIAQHLVTLIGFVIAGTLIVAAAPGTVKDFLSCWPILLALILIIHALGGLISALSAKFGKLIGMILYLAALIAVIVTGVYFLTEFILTKSSSITVLFDINSGFYALIILASLVLDALFFLLLYATVRNKNIEI